MTRIFSLLQNGHRKCLVCCSQPKLMLMLHRQGYLPQHLATSFHNYRERQSQYERDLRRYQDNARHQQHVAQAQQHPHPTQSHGGPQVQSEETASTSYPTDAEGVRLPPWRIEPGGLTYGGRQRYINGVINGDAEIEKQRQLCIRREDQLKGSESEYKVSDVTIIS